MSARLSAYANSRDNNFNLVRFVAAALVLYSHGFAIALGSGDAEPLRNTVGMTWGLIAVDVFFVTSGFLITSSYFARNNLTVFAWARIMRIYPALLVAVLFCVFVVGLSFTALSASEYLSTAQTYKFLFKNSLLFFGLEYDLPGVFDNNPWKHAVNGSLWTLPYEVRMYAMLAAILFAIGYLQNRLSVIRSPKIILLFIAISAVAANIANHFHPYASVHFVHLFTMFFVGAAYYAWREHVRLSLGLFAVAFASVLIGSLNADVFFVLYVISVPYLTLFIAYVPSGRIRNFNKVGDYSYGVYIYAFPVQQSIAALGPGISVASMILTSFSVTLFLSVLSWHLIEKRCLKLKNSRAAIDRFVRSLRLGSRINWIKRGT